MSELQTKKTTRTLKARMLLLEDYDTITTDAFTECLQNITDDFRILSREQDSLDGIRDNVDIDPTDHNRTRNTQ